MWNCDFLFLNLTNLCNVRCKKCITPLIVEKRGELSIDLLFIILNLLKFNGFKGLIRCGLGENLIYSHMEDFLRYLSVNLPKYKVDILTNGMAFNVDKYIYFNNDRVRWGITLDGMVQNDIENLQIGIDIEKVKSNLFEIRNKYPQSNLYLNYTLHNRNLHHLFDFVMMAIKLNIQDLFVTPLKVFKNYNTEFLSGYIPDISSPPTIKLFSEIKNIAIKNNIRIRLPDIIYHFVPCKESGNYTPIIDIDGKTSFCAGREHIKIGHIANPEIALTWMKIKKNIEKNKKNFCSNCLSIKNQGKAILEMP
jgi:MoaA/NifB/PqqE/SkfB family radical SAM enzyme